MASAHDGHRRRVKSRFLSEGLDVFEPHNALELLLFFATPIKDTNLMAHKLINHFGNFSAVCDAPFDELLKINGIGESSATLIKLIPAMTRYYLTSKNDAGMCIDSSRRACDFLIPYFHGFRDELAYLVCLDAKGKILCCHLLFSGSVNLTHISIRRVVETALTYNSSGVILAHNHPSGVALPSDDDLATTRKLGETLSAVGVNLIDHIIVADDDAVSLADSGYMQR